MVTIGSPLDLHADPSGLSQGRASERAGGSPCGTPVSLARHVPWILRTRTDQNKVWGYHATEPYKKAVRKRQLWVEPLFAEAMEWHGLRRLRLRGLRNANIQGLLIAAGQNLKRFLAATGWGRRHTPYGGLLALPTKVQRFSAVSV